MGKLLLNDGTQVPGATTISGLLDKPFLVKWANKLGKQQIDVEQYVNRQKDIGKLIHSIVESHVTKTPVDLESYDDEDIKLGESVFFRNYMKWESEHDIECLNVEMSLVSHIYRFGGILDMYCILDGKYTVVDFKTSKSINLEQLLQVSSYVELLRENGLQVDQAVILDVYKEPKDSYIEKILDVVDTFKYWELFEKLIDVYYLLKEIEKK